MLALTSEQELFVDFIQKSFGSCLITGAAGTGKSELVKRLSEWTDKRVVFTASTGAAAARLPSGVTLASFAGIGTLDTATAERMFEHAKRWKAGDRWRSVEILVIDEISMVSRHVFECLHYIACKFRAGMPSPTGAFFGGIRVVAVGDFLQLPPFSKDEGAVVEKCYKSPIWRYMWTIFLTKPFRQSDPSFLTLLNKIRVDNIDDVVMGQLLSLSRVIPNMPRGLEPVRLTGKNHDAQTGNAHNLALLDGEPVVYSSLDNPSDPVSVEKLNNRLKVEACLCLKLGAQVMCLKNCTKLGLVNGSLGAVTNFVNLATVAGMNKMGSFSHPGLLYPVVRFIESSIEVVFGFAEFEVNDPNGDVVCKRQQVPLTLAWFTTIHKSQGMTVDLLEVDLEGAWEEGQVYVAISRARSMDRLRVLNYKPGITIIACDQKARLHFDSVFNKLLEIYDY
jgi:ATP-dependent DNA helicase PIF1